MPTATCCCGQLRALCAGEPVRISICHCLACQQRTGSVFGVQARFPSDQVTVEGQATRYDRVGDSGGQAAMYFCPRCGSTVYWELEKLPGFTAVAVGAFADPAFGSPIISIYEARKHPWVSLPQDIEHWD